MGWSFSSGHLFFTEFFHEFSFGPGFMLTTLGLSLRKDNMHSATVNFFHGLFNAL